MTRAEPAAEVMEFSMTWDRPEQSSDATASATPWEVARDRLAEADTYWLSTVDPEGRPHAVPVLAVWTEDALHFCASDRSRKAKNLTRDPHCAITSSARALDVVVEGQAMPIDAPATLQRVAQEYRSKYDWRPEVRDGALWADGAPTAGPPPYRVYAVRPSTAFGFPTSGDEMLTPTRWRF
jgi:nitroimidazol reductase NimA-like FMN-containing flavoprotein (pyridoxamine 5'-phosphate oxidase superfamily)